jgi:hypothetical protein
MALPRSTPPIETTSLAEAGRDLGLVFDRVNSAGTHVVVADADGQPIGAIVSLADVRAVQQMDTRRQEVQKLRKRLSENFGDYAEDELEAEILGTIEDVERTRRQD